jgi:pentatricopeptide repeat protein
MAKKRGRKTPIKQVPLKIQAAVDTSAYNMDEFSDMMQTLFEKRHFDKVLSRFDKWLDNHTDQVHRLPREVLHAAMCSAKKLKQYDKAEHIFHHMQASDDELIDWDYNVMIDVYVKTNKIKQARQLLDYMKNSGLELKVYSFGPLIHRCIVTPNRFDEAMELYDEMRSFNVQPNSQFCNGILKACAEHGSTDRVEQLLTEMAHCKHEVEAVSMEALLSGKIKISRKIVDLLTQMDLHLTARQLDFLVDLCCRNAGDILASKLMKNAKKKLKLSLLASTYEKLINTLCLKGKINQARDVFDEAIREGTRIGSPTRKRLEMCEIKLNSMEEKSSNAIPKCATDSEQPTIQESSGELLSAELKDDLNLLDLSWGKSLSYFQSVVNKYLERYNGAALEGLMLNIQKAEHENDEAMFNQLLGGYCNLKQVNSLEKILSMMQGQGFKVSFPNVKCLVNCLCSLGMVGKAEFFVKNILTTDKVPVEVVKDCYDLLLKEYCKHGAIPEVLSLLSDLKTFNVHPSAVTVKMIVQMCCSRQYASEAVLVLRFLHSIGFPMDLELHSLVSQSFPESKAPGQPADPRGLLSPGFNFMDWSGSETKLWSVDPSNKQHWKFT